MTLEPERDMTIQMTFARNWRNMCKWRTKWPSCLLLGQFLMPHPTHNIIFCVESSSSEGDTEHAPSLEPMTVTEKHGGLDRTEDESLPLASYPYVSVARFTSSLPFATSLCLCSSMQYVPYLVTPQPMTLDVLPTRESSGVPSYSSGRHTGIVYSLKSTGRSSLNRAMSL